MLCKEEEKRNNNDREMCELLQEYKWINDFDGKILTLPAATNQFIEIVQEPIVSVIFLKVSVKAHFLCNTIFSKSEC